MEFTIKAGSPEKLKNGCVVAGVLAGGELGAAARALDVACDGAISSILARGELDDKAGATLMLHALPGLATPRVLLVSLGKRDELSDKAYRDAVAAAAKQLAGSAASDAAFCLAEIELPKRDLAWRLAQAAQILKDSTYRCDELKSKKDESKKGVRKLVFVVKNKAGEQLEHAVRRGEVVGFAGLMGAGRTELARSVFGRSFGIWRWCLRGWVFAHGRPVYRSVAFDALSAIFLSTGANEGQDPFAQRTGQG